MSGPEADPATVLSERYRLGGLLGAGGSASVFSAVDLSSGAEVALKILHPHLSERPAARAAFLAEARRAQPLQHPHLVRVLDARFEQTAAGPLTWIALERVPGRTLSEHVAEHGPLDAVAAVAVLDAVLGALEAVHASGLVHRDVSPANILVAASPDGATAAAGVRLIDFGLADVAGATTLGRDELLSVTVTGRAGVIGNANYVSPEQARGMPVDARGDLYQAGGVLHFLLTGRPPFPAADADQTVRAHLHAPPPVPSAHDARIPRGLDRIVVRAMLKDPDDRFRSAAAMRTALTGFAPATGGVPPERATATTPDIRPDEVTRILTRTAVPPRAVAATTTRPAPHVRTVRSRSTVWFSAGVGAAVVTAMILAAAANTSPTAVVEALPTPSATAPPTESAPSPTPPATASPPPAVPLVAVPDLGQHGIGEAEAALLGAGLVLGPVAVVDSVFVRDTVLASDPAPGEHVRPGSPVSLTVASGFGTVPDVAGQGRDAAGALVQAAGFVPSFASRTAAPGTPPGTILGTDPAPGTRSAVGTPITVLEAAPATPAPSPTPTDPGPTPTPTTEARRP